MLTTTEISPSPAKQKAPMLRAEKPLRPDVFAAIRRRMALEHFKWDSQIGDVCTLANFPLILRADVWRQLVRWADKLAVETQAAEEELLYSPQLHKSLALPWAIRRVLRRAKELGPTPAVLRIMRFDFHLTFDGWRITEVNSDVPGGFTESSNFTEMIAAHYPAAATVGDPAACWADAMLRVAGEGSVLALLSAPGFMEDHQIVAYLAKQLQKRGCKAFRAKPEQLLWRDGCAHVESAGFRVPLNAIVRFYQAEWLAKLPKLCGWSNLFCGGRTPVVNPGSAALTESKRFPLVWEALSNRLPTWQALLPETRDPRDAPWQTDEGWLLKSAFCNNGDTVSHRSHLSAREWASVSREVSWFPRYWAAQRRFEAAPINTPLGLAYPCIGVYTINGQVAGAYGRIARRAVIDYEAIDIAVLVEGAEQ